MMEEGVYHSGLTMAEYAVMSEVRSERIGDGSVGIVSYETNG